MVKEVTEIKITSTGYLWDIQSVVAIIIVIVNINDKSDIIGSNIPDSVMQIRSYRPV